MYKKLHLLSKVCILVSLPLILNASNINPFAVNNGEIPTKMQYDGPLWKFKYNYPTTYVNPSMPWRDVLKGKPLSKDNAYNYIMTLKKYISPSIKNLILDPKKWNTSSQKGWYSMLWAGQEVKIKVGDKEENIWDGRDSIYGTYTGQVINKSVYAKSGLKVDIQNHATIYYNEAAAYTLHNVWKNCDEKTKKCIPSISNNEAQFKEGAIVIKAAGVNASPEEWPVLEGAAKWQIFRKPFNDKNAKPKVIDLRVGIFDIIVKDSIASPKTGWVFTTLVYDKDAKGNAWDKMIPLGAMWGNDPAINSEKEPLSPLIETYINPLAPAYSTVTLGYGNRLSGPFDIAVKYNVEIDGKKVKELRSSSCLSCHGTSVYPGDLTFFYPAKDPNQNPWEMYTPGSKEWNEWFQNRNGTTPQSNKKGAIALDYSTFLEAVLMNYASTLDTNKNSNSNMFVKWKKYRQLRQNY
ncbi:conserved hypothetical protein [Arcobacter nitrofigilis DSM 7299]|uniref:Cytochrome c domain-containing protein n=1 Tax=Arcobacter nitrofigilis (strain ATCC 33309 / DSM 7299 / CCUG 15893 / LMG 7604 / NCTC 12251 / CI) TaxID=572480 RepID=D5UZN7_ARCNC|nr:hypothetical protein [Arcobacter nitrofigilis]ADG93256.1 conserved hypothetical protein [Arcobacter nitrofigilis DSM 7299]